MTRTAILLVFGILLMTWTIRAFRAHRLKERYAILMVLTGVPFLVLAFWPDGIIFVAESLRIEKATVLILAVATFMTIMIFQLLSIVSIQDQKIHTLAQLTGILLLKEKNREQLQASQPTDRQDPAD